MHSITKYINHFIQIDEEGNDIRDNNDLYRPLRAWALEKMETLTLQKMTEIVNEILESAKRYDPVFITNYNISYPLKESSVRRWMGDLDFKHIAAKKSYMITVHERPDVREDRKKHILNNRKLELNEPCWIQFKINDFKCVLKIYLGI